MHKCTSQKSYVLVIERGSHFLFEKHISFENVILLKPQVAVDDQRCNMGTVLQEYMHNILSGYPKSCTAPLTQMSTYLQLRI